jgi:hypothetical protein
LPAEIRLSRASNRLTPGLAHPGRLKVRVGLGSESVRAVLVAEFGPPTKSGAGIVTCSAGNVVAVSTNEPCRGTYARTADLDAMRHTRATGSRLVLLWRWLV